jgi:GrpB-like predicted nucleotidyltransferase (UPF0157 family)
MPMTDIDTDPAYGLGLEQGVNRLVDYNPLWPRAFAEEATRLKDVLGDAALAIEHYGSTSVPGLRAKPIIDIQVGVADIAQGFDFIAPLATLGYDYAGDQGIPEHHIFGRQKVRTHLTHIVVFESHQWFRTLRFRDRLRTDPAARAAYAALKDQLAATTTTRAEYTAAKTRFVEEHSR